jgi:hypothetical protein
MTSWKVFEKINWSIYEPVSSAKMFDDETQDLTSAKSLMTQKVPIKKGDRIVILTHCTSKCRKTSKEEAVLSEPLRGSTVKDVLNCLHKGLHKNLKPGNRGHSGIRGDYYFEKDQKYPFPKKNEVVYDKISGYFDSSARLRLIKKYEAGLLKPHELYGDHRYFEGINRKGKLLYFSVGS